MADTPDIPEEAVTDASIDKIARALVGAYGTDRWSHLPISEQDAWRIRARAAVAAALPIVLAARPRPRLVPGDVPITERTPHGVWIADGPDPEPSLTVPCAGLSGCDDCRKYNDLRQHLVEQIVALDAQHQREMADLVAARDNETAEPAWQVGDKAVWRGREVKVLAVNQVVIEDLGMALTRDANELEQHPDDAPLRGGK